MGSQNARKNRGALRHFAALSFASAFVFIASTAIAFAWPAGSVGASNNTGDGAVPGAQDSLTFTQKPAEKTNQTSLSWQWELTPGSEVANTYTGYQYTLKTGDGTVISQGSGDTSLLSYTFAGAVSCNTYTLTVSAVLPVAEAGPATGVNEGANAGSGPAAAPVAVSSVSVNTGLPVVTSGEANWAGSTATPSVLVAPPVACDASTGVGEPVYTYEWLTDAPAEFLTIADPFVINPAINFYASGTAVFTLLVTDDYGNVTEHELVLDYDASTGPIVPVGPVGPVEPVDPVDPVDPTNPVNPAEPVAPVNPVTPPVKPATPATPGDSTPGMGSAGATGVTAKPAVRVALAYAGNQTPVAADSVNTNTEDLAAKVDEAIAATENSNKEVAVNNDAAASTGPISVGSPARDWKFLGIEWYWWLLVFGIVSSGLLWYQSYRNAGRADDI